MYIRTVADAEQYASYIHSPAITPKPEDPEPELLQLVISEAPAKTRYLLGQQLDTTGLVVTAVYEDGSTVELTEGYTISGFDAETAGQKTVTVTYEGLTASFKVRVYEAAQILSHPQDQEGAAGTDVQFAVEATEASGYRWQYLRPGKQTWLETTMDGYNTNTLTVTVTAGRAGYQYRCVVIGKDGSQVISEPATLGVTVSLAIDKQPADRTAAAGTQTQFSVAAELATAYRWQYRSKLGGTWFDTSMEGCDTDTLTVTVTANRDGYQYRCIVTDEWGNSVASEAATLQLLYFTAQVQDQTSDVGDNAQFHVAIEGAQVVKYRWQYRRSSSATWFGTSMEGYDTDTLTVGVTANRNGYQYRCVITCSDGSEVLSDAGTLHVIMPPAVITAQPTDQTAFSGGTVRFRAAAADALSYRWQYRRSSSATWFDTSMEGYNTTTLVVPVTESREGYQYRCVITGKDGNQVFTNAGTVYILQLETQPADQTEAVGSNATFTVKVNHADTVRYRWEYCRVGTDIWYETSMTGYNTDTLNVAVTKSRNGYQYRCVIIDATGTKLITDPATLTVE